MKKAILILLILMCAIGSQAQTAYDKKQDTRMSSMASAILAQTNQINILAAQVKTLDSTLKVFQGGMVKSNTMNFIYPLNGMKDPILPNTFNVTFDTLYLKR